MGTGTLPHNNTTTTAFKPLDTTSTLRPAHLHCPQCQRSAKRQVELQLWKTDQTDFFHCGDCGGAWFQDKEVDVALRATASIEWPEPKNPAESSGNREVSEWACPCCQGTLVSVRDRRGSGASVRRCLVCYGGWIDCDDIKLAAEASTGLLSYVGKFIRGAFSA